MSRDDGDGDDDEYKMQQHNPKAQVLPCGIYNLTACRHSMEMKLKLYICM